MKALKVHILIQTITFLLLVSNLKAQSESEKNLNQIAETNTISKDTTKTWKLKVDKSWPEKFKKQFEGKAVKEGENKIDIAKGCYVNFFVNNGSLVKCTIVRSYNSDLITIDMKKNMKQRQNNETNTAQTCRTKANLCMAQCKLGGPKVSIGNLPDCDKQCFVEEMICRMTGDRSFGDRIYL